MERKPAYGWVLLAAAATAALCFLPHLHLAFQAAEAEDAELMKAFGTLTAFAIQAVLMIPLLCVTPALWARSAWRTHPAALGLLALVAFATGHMAGGFAQEGLYAMLLITPAGVLLYGMQRAGFSNFRIVFYGSVVLLAGLFCQICLPSMIAEGDAFLPLRNLVSAYETEWKYMTELMTGIDASQRDAAMTIGDMITELKIYPEVSMLQLLYYPAAFAALSNGLLSHLFNRKGGADLKKLPPFEDWQVESGYFYGTLVLTVVAYILTMTGVSYGMGLLRVAYAMWLLPMSLAGLCALKRWTKSRPWMFILICVFTGLMYSMIGQLLAIFGMLSFMQQRMKRRMQGGDK